MKRRNFLQLASGVLLLPHMSYAKQQTFLELFNKNLKSNSWLLGWQGINEEKIATNKLEIFGKIPKALQGSFYRNGPAVHQADGERNQHWFDGDGMIQKFHIANGSASHLGKMVQTKKHLIEKKQNKFIFPTFGTYRDYKVKNPDEMNPSNISLLPVNNRIFSLWEGGSPYEINPHNLDTLGIHTWSDKTKNVPFGAHYKKDSDGSVWNIGYVPYYDSVVIWHIDKLAKLKKMKVLSIKNTPMMHDFMITKNYIVLVLPPFLFNKKDFQGKSFIDSFAFHKQEATKILLVDKNTLTVSKTFELPAQFVFHFVNAYEKNNEIIFESMRYKNTKIISDLGNIMKGDEPQNILSMPYQTRLNLTNKKVTEEQINSIVSEFPVIDENETGQIHSNTVLLQKRKNVFFDTVAITDHKTQNQKYFTYENQLVEEHLIVKNNQDKQGDWIIGTSLDYVKKQTNLNVFNVNNLADGPVAIAKLPYVLPLGLHGKWVQQK